MALATAAGTVRATPLDEVIAAERAFAADAQTRGWVAAFKAFAAAEAIVFQPDPVNAQAMLAQRPDQPADTSLKWWPIWAGVAASGELGFTTGPYVIGDNAAFGHYFTVWQKQPDGAWRWIFDGGPRSAARSPFGPDTEPARLAPTASRSADAAAAMLEVAAAEKALARAATANVAAAYLAVLADDGRIMGSTAPPAIGRAAFADELARRSAAIEFTALGGTAAQAGDLSFTYGTAAWTENDTPRRGHYARIWQKRAAGWRLAFDEILVVPPQPDAPP